MPATSAPEPPIRLLLVGHAAAWDDAARDAAGTLGARLDILPDVTAALAWMLQGGRVYTHVLALAPLGSKEVDALAGMLDELTFEPTKLLLLGGETGGGQNRLTCVAHPSATSLVAAILGEPSARPASLQPLSTAELGHMLHTGGLRMRFQPILDAKMARPIGMEALARIHHKVRGILHPKDFIPLIVAGRRERVLAGITATRTFLDIGTRLHGSGLFVSLNLPISVLLNEGALQRGLELCAVAGVSPTKLVIEILETRTLPDLAGLRRALEAWRAAGFRTAIDDAGPDLPHWRDMLDLPFDIIKLDAALLADRAHDALLADIAGRARAAGRFIVAEGIQDEAGLERVRRLGVNAVQGFLFARPLPALAVPVWLRQHATRPAVQAA